MKFGLGIRNKLTGADLAIKILQIAAILPVVYTLILSGYPPLITKNGMLSFLFGVGISSLHRAEAFFLSFIFQKSLSESITVFIPLVIALIFGLVASRFLKKDEKSALKIHYALLVIFAADLVLRLLPFAYNSVWGLGIWLITLFIRISCILLTVLDIRSANKEKRL